MQAQQSLQRHNPGINTFHLGKFGVMIGLPSRIKFPGLNSVIPFKVVVIK